MEIFQNTYLKLDRDTAINKYDNKSYYDARNVRIVTDDSLKSGAMNNMKGNELMITFSTSPLWDNNYQIMGTKKVRDQVIVFFSRDLYNDDYILSFPIDEQWSHSNMTILWGGDLNMSPLYPVEDIEAFYESPDVVKIYWTDNYNNLRYCNIADPNLASWTAEEFEIVQELSMSQPEFATFGAGNLTVGYVQYAYRLYKLHGPATNFCPAGRLIPLTTESEGAGSSKDYGGSDYLDENGDPISSGKSVRIKIENVDISYDRIEVVAIHYTAINSEPTINVIQVAPTTSTMYFTDNGDWDAGQYSIAEFNLINNPFKAKTISSKNNILFAANISGTEYDLDYDARAYRFSHSSAAGAPFAFIYDHESTGPMQEVFPQAGDYGYAHGWWGNHNWRRLENGVYVGGNITTANLPVDIDAIQRNDNEKIRDQVNTTNVYVPRYQIDMGTLGGTGVNLSYVINLQSDIPIDASYNDPNTDLTFYVNSAAAPYYYNGVDSPYYNQFASWERDEVYRFGVVFFDVYGRPSPVKWIGDIRMPCWQERVVGTRQGPFYTSAAGNTVAKRLQVVFTMFNIPSSAQACQIVYVPRTVNDQTVVCQGRLGFIKQDSLYCVVPRSCDIQQYDLTARRDRVQKDLFYMISPDISVLKSFNQTSRDYLEVIGQLDRDITNVSMPLDDGPTDRHYSNITKFQGATINPIVTENVAAAKIHIANTTLDEQRGIDSLDDRNYRPMFYRGYDYNLQHYNQYMDLGTALIIKTDDDVDLRPTYNRQNTGFMVNYRRILYGSQYGGNSFEDRTRNVYIPAGPMVTITAGFAQAYANWGDTWIGFHDNVTGYWNDFYYEDGLFDGNEISGIAPEYFPVESRVNMTYRHDVSYHQVYNLTQSYYLKEYGNAEFTISGKNVTSDTAHYKTDWPDYYVYNTVYSRRADVRYFIPAPLDYIAEFTSDTLVQASNMKEGLETIDAWTIFAANEYINVDARYGPINKLHTWTNQLFYWQDDAVGALSVLERTLISDASGNATTLGQGEVLQRYDTIRENLGMSTRFSSAVTPAGIYWFDGKRNRMHRFRQSIEDLGTIKGLNSYFKDIPKSIAETDNTLYYNQGFMMASNPYYNEIWLTIQGPGYNETVIYNEVLDAFVSFTSHYPSYLFSYNETLISSTTAFAFQENVGNYGEFFGSVYDSSLQLIVVPMPNMPVTFTNYEITSEVFNGTTQVHDQTITTIQTENDYQDTGELNISSSNSRRLIRTWKVDAGRDAASSSPRLRDTYAKVTMKYENTNNYNLVLHDFVTLYMVPMESIANKMKARQ